jgi:hypothetical protein
VEEMAHRRAGLAGDPDLSHTRPSICPWAGGLAGERRKFEAPFRVRSGGADGPFSANPIRPAMSFR